MAITIVVEDGSIVAGANSFVSLEDAKTIAEQLGLVLSADDEVAKSQLVQGYYQLVRSYESRLQGRIVNRTQTGIFPRYDVVAKGFYVPSNEIPVEAINAQLSYADSINKGSDMNQTASSQEVQSESLDGVGSKTYKQGSSRRTTPSVPAVTQWLQPFMKGNSLTRDDYFYDRGFGGRYVG